MGELLTIIRAAVAESTAQSPSSFGGSKRLRRRADRVEGCPPSVADEGLEVEIQPGETTKLTLDPRGALNLNAAPSAEVWVDGDKIGETPLANAAIRLGVREIVFKNPQFPDRKVVTTIKAKTSDTISVDFNKDK